MKVHNRKVIPEEETEGRPLRSSSAMPRNLDFFPKLEAACHDQLDFRKITLVVRQKMG